MSRIFLSPLIVDIRGKQSDTVFSKWKGINYIRSRVIPANPQTAAQTAIRNALKRLVGLWQDAAAVLKANWNYAMSGRDKSGFNHWIGKQTVDEKDGNLLDVTLDNGYDKLTTFTPSTGTGSGEIDVAFAPTPVPAGKPLKIMARKSDTDAWGFDNTYTNPQASPITITGLDAATSYQVYGFLFKDGYADGSEVGQASSGTATSGA